MICANCGAPNPPGSLYCGGCGTPMASVQQDSSVQAPGDAAAVATAELAILPGSVIEQPSLEEMPGSSGVDELPTVRVVEGATPSNEAKSVDQAMGRASADQQSAHAEEPYARPDATPVVASEFYQPEQPVSPEIFYQPSSADMATPQVSESGYAAAPMQSSGVNYPAGLMQSSGVNYPPVAGGSPSYVPVQGSGANYPTMTVGVYPSPSDSYPGQPSGTLYAGGSHSSATMPNTPMPLPQTGMAYPGQSAQMSWPGYGVPITPTPKEPSKLIKPLPLWAFLTGIAAILVLLLVLFFVSGSDWAAGAQTAGEVALGLAVVILIVFLVRTGLGMLAQTNPHRRSQILSAVLLALVLFALSTLGLTQQSGFHIMQAHYLESQKQWQRAIDEYQAGGENAPASVAIAQVYNEWGEQDVSQQNYKDAIIQFNVVIDTYNQAGSQVTRAQNDEISAYKAWAGQATQLHDYSNATSRYDQLLSQPFCSSDSECETSISQLDATAYYDLAEQQLNAQDYKDAVNTFQKLTTTVSFQNAPEVKEAHTDYAKALWGLGQQDLSATCSDALPIYQQLSTSFADTTQGQEAATALKQPQAVTGHFAESIPGGSNTPEVALTQGVSASMSSDAFYAILAKSPTVVVKANGDFTFPSIKQGTYYLVWGTINNADGEEEFLVGQQYPATVGPLCPFDFGDINEAFPQP